MDKDNLTLILINIKELVLKLTSLIDVITLSNENKIEEKEEVKTDDVEESQKNEYTLIDVRTLLASLSKEGYTNDVKALLRKYGAEKLSGVNPSDYEAIINDAEVLKNGK